MREFEIKRAQKHPFDKSDVYDKVFVLVERSTWNVVAVLDEDICFEGVIITENDIKVRMQDKKNKHIVIGDTVIFGKYQHLEGEVDWIEDDLIIRKIGGS